MGLFGFFKKKQGLNVKLAVHPNLGEEMELTEVIPGLSLPRAFALHWPEIEKTRLAAVAITATPSEELALEQSKFGHYPCVPIDFEYPKDAVGRYMYPLAQINCAELPLLEGYPTSGYLQFYISAFDDVYGMDFDAPRTQGGFRVLYFEDQDVEKYKADFSFLDETMASDQLPVYKPHALRFALKNEYVGIGDVRYKENDQFSLDAIAEKYPDVKKQLEDISYDRFSCNGHKIGGYAFFTQEDPRCGNSDFKDYILLLQIDTDDEIMWGDSGVANFFIHPADLANKDFSKVVYNWDCC